MLWMQSNASEIDDKTQRDIKSRDVKDYHLSQMFAQNKSETR